MEQDTFFCCRCDRSPQTWTKVSNAAKGSSMIKREYYPLDLVGSGNVNTEFRQKGVLCNFSMRGFSMLMGAEVTLNGRITEEERKKTIPGK